MFHAYNIHWQTVSNPYIYFLIYELQCTLKDMQVNGLLKDMQVDGQRFITVLAKH